MRRLFARVMNLFRGEAAERELAREIESHLALLQEDFERRGTPPEEAKLAARKAYGSVEVAKELHRDARGFPWFESFLKDLRHGARGLMRAPGFTAVAVITLALGIGANTAVFSVVNAVLLRPLAYVGADRLVTLLHDGANPVSPANFIDWREQSSSFQAMAAAEVWSPNITGSSPPEHVRGHRMTRDLLPMLGVQPLFGRWFLNQDGGGRDSEREVILSYGLWQRRYNSDEAVLGTPITLNGEQYTVVGVMPREFVFAPFWAPRGELWVPLDFGGRVLNRGGNSLRVFARLRPGVTVEQAQAEVAMVTARLEQQYPASNRNVLVTPLLENVVGKVDMPLRILLGAVGFVLLIACSNVSHMLLARTSERHRELAVRTALGAGRARLMGQLVTENLLLAVLGGAAALVPAYWGTKMLVALGPANLPRVETVSIDGSVLLFVLGVTVLTTVLFGVAPALHTAAGKLGEALKEGGRGGSDGIRRSRLRGFLVASQFTLAFMLLIGAGLMVRSFFALRSVDPGFDPRNVLSMVVSVAGTSQEDPGRRETFYRELLARVNALPRVRSAGAINHLPLAGDLWGLPFEIDGREKPRPGESPLAAYRIVMPGYFETMRLPVIRGRAITDQDDLRSPGVVVINERAAQAFWPQEDPIGKRITFESDGEDKPVWLTIIGVAQNAKQLEWASDPQPEVYLAALQNRRYLGTAGAHMAYITLVARTDGNPADLTGAVQQTVWSFDRNLTISQVLTMEAAVASATAQPRFEMFLFAVFAGVALVLAGVGIYGVMSYSVSRRTHEIGIRMSLGASWGDVVWMVVRQGMAQATAGTIAGITGALLLSKLLVGMLYGVQPTDPLTFGVAAVALALIALVAASIPARKAAQIEPVIALRNE
jgi:predicted permease